MMGFSLIAILNKPTIQTFIGGIFFGIVISLLMCQNNIENSENSRPTLKSFDPHLVGDHSKNDTHHRMLDYSLAVRLYNEVKVLCWVMTGPQNHVTKARHVKATWGKRCNKLLFMSSESDRDLPAVGLPVKEGRPHLWDKTKHAMKYVFKYYYDDYDWFFKADDDTYVIMENLRYLLYYAKKSDPVYYGGRLKGTHGDYMGGGAGYVLSKEALRRFVEEALPNRTICKQGRTGDEDVEIGRCLRNVGVELGDTLDNEERHRFTPVFVNEMLIPGHLNEVEWYMRMVYNSERQGFSCCSDNLISTHYVSPYHMYLLEYLIYHVTPFGIAYHPTLHLENIRAHDYSFYERINQRGSTKAPQWNDYD